MLIIRTLIEFVFLRWVNRSGIFRCAYSSRYHQPVASSEISYNSGNASLCERPGNEESVGSPGFTIGKAAEPEATPVWLHFALSSFGRRVRVYAFVCLYPPPPRAYLVVIYVIFCVRGEKFVGVF